MPGWGELRVAWGARVPDAIGTPEGARRPLLSLWPFLLIAVFSFSASLTVFPLSGPWSWVAVPLAALVSLPAVLARPRPVAAGATAAAANLVMALGLRTLPEEFVSPPWFLNVAPAQLAAAYVLGLVLPTRAVAAAVAVIAATGVVFVLVSGRGTVPAELLAWSALLAVAGLLGVRHQDRHVRALGFLADGEQRRVQEERERIARELHDVVAHHMSVIAVRSVSASRRIPQLPAAAVAEFDELAASAREALGELRQMLGVRGGAGGPALEPQPGLADLRRLAERTSGAGTPVELSVSAPSMITAATAVSAYRIVQEALSNVTRHATGARTRVRVAPDENGTALLVEVGNEPSPAPPRHSSGGGNGLAGMRERVRLLGGELAAGPTDSGGFTVRAELPLERGR